MEFTDLFGLVTLILPIFTFVNGGRNSNIPNNDCNKEINLQGDQIFTWKYSRNSETNLVISEPACLYENGTIILRKCSLIQGEWIPKESPVCERSPINFSQNKICPEDLVEISLPGRSETFCVKISKDLEEWNDHLCQGSDASIFDLNDKERDELYEYLKSLQNVEAFWIPVQRADNNRYNPLIWKLPGKNWGDIFTAVEYNELTDKNCLIATVNPVPVFEMSHCNEQHHTVCIFKRKNLAIKSACPNNYGAMSYKPNICYGIEWDVEPHGEPKQLSTGEYFKNRNTIRQILNMIDFDNDKYFLLNPTFVDGIEYDILMNIKEKFKIATSYRFDRYLSQEMIESAEPVDMCVKIDHELDGIILTVYNRKYIWRIGNDHDDDYGIKCFTNADYDTIRSVKIKDKIWENHDQSKTMFELKLQGNGPGYYWCEAHTIFNFTKVHSKKIVAARKIKGHTFALFFDVQCDSRRCEQIHGNRKQLGRNVERSMKNLMSRRELKKKFDDLKLHDVRVMNVVSINEDLKSVKVLCHISASLKNSAVDDSDEISSEEDDEKEDDLGIRHDISIRMELRNLLKDLIGVNNVNASSVNSTEFCFPELLPDYSKKLWSTARLGETSTTKQLCLQADGLPVTRKCIGDFLYGAMWEKVDSDKVNCIQNIPQGFITSSLYDLHNSLKSKTEPEQAIKDVRVMVQNNIDHLIPADLFYLGRILQSVSSKVIASKDISLNNTFTISLSKLLNISKAATGDIISIYNDLMKVNVGIIKPSTKLNSTNILLDAFERLIDEVSAVPKLLGVQNNSLDTKTNKSYGENELLESISYPDGVEVKITPKLIVFIIDPNIANITGLALYEAKNDSVDHHGEFENSLYRFLYSNQSTVELLEEEGLELATFVPETLLNRLDEISLASKNLTVTNLPDPRIVIKIFSNDRLFQENRDITDKKVYSKIISISIPGHDRDLPELLPLIMRSAVPENNQTETSCRYWDYSTWASDGLVFLGRSATDDRLVWCGCSHLTPFAYLIGGSYNLSVTSDIVVITDIHREALDIITLLGCSLSLVGIIGIFITAITFQSWRQKASSKVLLQLSAAIALQMVLFCFVNTEDYSLHLIENHIFSSCVALGACLQYSVLVQFCWMMIIAYLQFKRYVKVFGNNRPKRFFIKSFFIGWGLPLIPVVLVVILDRQSYIPRESAGSAICYPTGQSLYLGILLPVALVILGNLIIFFAVIYNIMHGPNGAIRHIEKKMAISQIRLSVLLFFLLGFTWIFGLLTAMKAGILFSYLFSLTATIQGFVLFVYFIILDPVTRSMWTGYLRRLWGIKQDKSSVKDSTTSL